MGEGGFEGLSEVWRKQRTRLSVERKGIRESVVYIRLKEGQGSELWE